MSRRIRRRQETKSLLDLGAGVCVDLKPDRDLDDDRRFPLHGHYLHLKLAVAKVRLGQLGCQPITLVAHDLLIPWRQRPPSPTETGGSHAQSDHLAGFRQEESLLDLGAGVSVDFQPHRDLDDDGRLPLHGDLLRSSY
jgi:hypothetical protein